MTNRKTTKRALFSSIFALLICCSMLVGTTFAWFTDSEFIKDNVIKAGTLDIALDEETKLFSFSDNWEPGFSDAATVAFENIGTLALKYSFAIANLDVTDGAYDNTMDDTLQNYPDGSNIATVLHVYEGTTAADMIDANYLGTVADLAEKGFELKDNVLLPGEKADINLIIHMDEEAGNEYMFDEIRFDIVVVATQYTYEEDVWGNDQYDANATTAVTVNSEAELAAAVGAGKDVLITRAFDIDNEITVTGDVTITLAADITAKDAISRPFVLEDGATLTIDAGDQTVTLEKYGLVKIPAAGEVNLNGGNYVAATDNGAFVKIADTATDVKVTMNEVTYVDNGFEGFIINAYMFGGDAEITIVNSDLTSHAGIVTSGDVSVKDSKITTKGGAFELSGDAIIDNCEIMVDPGVTVSTAPPAGVAVSYGGYAKVVNSKITVVNGVAYSVYSTGGNIEAANNDVNASSAYSIYEANSTITIDGKVNYGA